MDTSETSDVILASMLSINITEVSKIPPELRLVLISKFESMRNEIDLKRDGDVQDRKSTPRQQEEGVQEQQCSSEIEASSHFHHHSSQTTTTDDDFPGDFSFGFPTAADALASEAAFMENIGLYLNPKPALSKSHGGNKTPNPRNDHISTGDAIENDFLLLVGEGSQQSNIESSISKSRHQSLLSFLNKAKHSDGEDLENKSKDQMDQMVEGPSSLRGSWKLWNDQNGPDIWDDLFSSTAEEIYNIENNTSHHEVEDDDNDASLMEAVELVEKIANNNNQEMSNDDIGKYFCVPCNRSLSGKDAFYRHTLSELHFKRTLTGEKATGIEEEELKKMRHHRPLKRHKPNEEEETATPKFAKVNDNPDHQQACPCCKVNIPDGCLGKHLVSHFHYHRSLSHPDHNSLILSNISDIVKQAPFQCFVCKFYCNFSRTFLEHWKSQHQSQNVILENDQRLWCSTCRVSTTSEAQMLQHLQDLNHLEIESMINRSVPIVIKLIQLHQCLLCPKKFRLNFSLKLHMESSHSETEEDLTVLAKHKQHLHCRLCQKKFKTSNAYRLHKLSKTHFAKLRNDSMISSTQTCHLCGMESSAPSDLNEHMISCHIDFVSQCYTCGELFPIPQQLAAHIRNYCNRRTSIRSSQSRQRYKLKEGHNCSISDVESCDFVGKNMEVTQLHEAVVHRQSLSCFKCQRTFQSSSKLFHHLLGHRPTAERCGKCSALFSSKFQADNHQCRHHYVSKKKYTCQVDKCQYVTDKLSAMKSHLVTHQPKEESGKRPLTCPHCSSFSCTRPSQLKRHVQQIHQKHLLTTLQCPKCTYTTFSQQHLLRHQKNLHPQDRGGEEVFQCRLCSFSCTNLDNLRKHILKTKKHPKAMVYNCHLCPYSHNSMLDFRGHLMQLHQAELGEEEASTIVRLYFTVKTS